MDNTSAVNEVHLDYEQRINRCHEELSRRYQGLKLRWSRIYGSRWAYFMGGDHTVSFCPMKIQVNSHLGLYIDNPDIVTPEDLLLIDKLVRTTLSDKGD